MILIHVKPRQLAMLQTFGTWGDMRAASASEFMLFTFGEVPLQVLLFAEWSYDIETKKWMYSRLMRNRTRKAPLSDKKLFEYLLQAVMMTK